jgi:single-strand DNA-binding protein
MASYNKVVLVGNVTRDPEVRYVGAENTPVCDVGLAVSNPRNKDKTVFVDVTFWRRTAEVVGEYIKKGSRILVDGRLEMDSWEKDGQKRTKLYVEGEVMQMLDRKGEQASSDNEPETVSAATSDGDIPF